MRILMLAQFYPPIIGGEERHVRDLADFLAKRGHSVNVATLWREGLPQREDDRGVRIFRVRGVTQRWSGLFSDTSRPHAPPFPDPGVTIALRDIIASERIEIVHAHNWLLHSFLPLKRADGPRLVVTLHDMSLTCATKTAMRGGVACDGPGPVRCSVCVARHYGAPKGAVTLVANWAAAKFERRVADFFLPVSNAIAAGSGLTDGPTPYRVVPNFIRDDISTLDGEADERLEQLPRQPFLLFVGDLRRFKGVDVLIDAYAGLETAPPLVLIGRRCHDTPTRWPKNVHVFHDWPHAAVIHAWSRSMAGVLPSVGPEAFGIVLLEAMANGKPVIASSAGGIVDIVEDNVNGVFVQPGDRHGLAQAISALAADDGLRSRLGAGARRTAAAFTASNVVPRIEAVYDEVLARRRPASAIGGARGSSDLPGGPDGFDAALGSRELGGGDAL